MVVSTLDSRGNPGFRCEKCGHMWLHEHMAKACENKHYKKVICSQCKSSNTSINFDRPFSGDDRSEHHVSYDCDDCGYQGYMIDGWEVDE